MHSIHQHSIPAHDEEKYYQLVNHVAPRPACAPPTRVVSEPAPNLMLLPYCCFLGPLLSSIVACWVFQQTDAKIRVWNVKGLLGNSTCERERETAVFVRGEIPDHEADLTVSARSTGSCKAKTPTRPTWGKNGQAFVLLDGELLEKNVMSVWMMKQSLKKLTAVSANHTPHKPSSFLEIWETHFQMCHRYW